LRASTRPIPNRLPWQSCPFPYLEAPRLGRSFITCLSTATSIGRDAEGRTIIQLAVDDRVLETLMTFDADAAELEPEADDEEDGPPVIVELVQPKAIARRRGPWQGRLTKSADDCPA
jgi:hypothetical protein